MLTALALGLGIAFVAWVFGDAALAALHRLAGTAPGRPLSLSITACTGLAAIATGAGILALFTRLGAVALGLTLAGAVFLFFKRWERRLPAGPGLPGLLLLAAAGFLGLVRTASPVDNYDTGAYHAQLIHWLEEYGFVPGLANLHDRLAFGAGWFVPSALFSLKAVAGQSLHVLNGTLFFLLLLFAVEGFARWRSGERSPALLLRIVLPVPALLLFGRWLSSPSPDVAVALLLWIVACLAVEAEAFWAVAVLAAFTVAIKLSALPVLLLPLSGIVRFWRRGERRAAAAGLATIAAILLPPVVQTIVTSGYPVFPLPALDPFSWDWKLPPELVERQYNWVKTWARLPHRPTGEILEMPLRIWLPLWWEHLKLPAQAALVALALLAPVGLWKRPKPLGTLGAGLGFWFLMAPDPRFAWGFLLPAALLLVFTAIWRWGKQVSGTALAAALLVLLAWEAYQIHGWEPRVFPEAFRSWRMPPDYPVPETRAVPYPGFTVQVPVENDRCWYRPFPCTPMPLPGLELRGPSFAQGFRATAPDRATAAPGPRRRPGR